MPRLIVVDRNGEEKAIEGEAGLSLMQVIRAAGIDELLALCGGCCCCATCRVHVDADAADRLPEISDDESDLLDATASADECSRLSCQIIFTDALDGLRVTIAQED